MPLKVCVFTHFSPGFIPFPFPCNLFIPFHIPYNLFIPFRFLYNLFHYFFYENGLTKTIPLASIEVSKIELNNVNVGSYPFTSRPSVKFKTNLKRRMVGLFSDANWINISF